MTKVATVGFCSNQIGIRCHRTVDEIDGEAWDLLVKDHLFLSRAYLRAQMLAKIPTVLVSFYMGKRLVGAAMFQHVSLRGAPLGAYIDIECPLLSWFFSPIKVMSAPFETTVLVCGTPFVAGPHGFCFSLDFPKQLTGSALNQAARSAHDMLDVNRSFSGVLFKEFCEESPVLNRLEERRFSLLKTEPVMVLELDPAWHNFEDYIASMSSKYRVKANRAYAKSKQLRCRDLSLDDLRLYRDQLRELHEQVVVRAPYRLGELSSDMLIALRQEMGREFIVKGYFLDDDLCGFLMAFQNGMCLEAGFVGIDYRLNRAHGIYPRMLYDYLKSAIDRGLSTVNYGRTAEEIKSTLGAVPVQMCCYVKLRKMSLNAMLPMVNKRVKSADFALRKPFKKEWYIRHSRVPTASLNR